MRSISAIFHHNRLAALSALLAAEALVAAVVTFAIPADQKNAFLLGRSLSRWGIIAGLALVSCAMLWLAAAVRRSQRTRRAIEQIIQNRLAGFIPLLLNFAIFGAFQLLQPSAASVIRLGPVIAFLELVGLQFLYFSLASGRPGQPAAEPGRKPAWAALVTALALYAAAAIPGPASASLNGLPWNTPAEYLVVLLLIPAALFIDWRAFTSRLGYVLAAAILVLKAAAFLLLPAEGLEVRVYRSPADLAAGRWVRTYQTIIQLGSSEIMTQPYERTRQFPIEWINIDDFEYSRLWFAVELSGSITLEGGERFAIQVAGAQEEQVTLIDQDGRAWQDGVIHAPEELTTERAAALPELATADLHGTFIFSGDQHFELIPLVVSPDGSTRSIFEHGNARLTSAGGRLHPALQALPGLVDVLFMTSALLFLAGAAWRQYRRGAITPVDLFLATAGLLVYWWLPHLSDQEIQGLIPVVLLIVFVARLPGFFLHDGQQASKGLLVSAGLITLILFIGLDLDRLRDIELFPQGQDNFRYQVISRRIYLEGDFFQVYNPPLIYKFLYPYLVGLLHILFGQSPAAQFFVNGWCAVLSATGLAAILESRNGFKPLHWASGILWLLLISGNSFFLFYFRFGLMEPLAVSLLILAAWFAIRGNLTGYLITGAFITLIRLDYIIVLLSLLVFTLPEPAGGPLQSLGQLVAALRQRWKRVVVSGLAFSAVPLTITLLFWLGRGILITSAEDTHHNSIFTILEGWFRILSGGNITEIGARFAQAPVDMLLLLLALYAGVIFALLPWFARSGSLSVLDRRWAIVIAALFATYILVRPTGYSPRFSTPLLPFAILAAADGLYRLVALKTAAAVESGEAGVPFTETVQERPGETADQLSN